MKKLRQFYKRANCAEAYGAAWGSHCKWLFLMEIGEIKLDFITEYYIDRNESSLNSLAK